MKAIETRYKGYRFRSRLEARWAVYFDTIGLLWEYEKEGFDLNGTLYLPDFWLPQVRMWAEVKPEELSAEELRKAALLAWKSKGRVLLLIGVPDCKPYDFLEYMDCNTWGEVGGMLGIRVGEDEGLIEKTDCVISMYHGYPLSEHRFFSSTGGVSAHDMEIKGMFGDVPAAVDAARSARFEHGEAPH